MSNFVKVNKNSDFELLMKNETSGCPFTFTFFVDSSVGDDVYVASYNGSGYTNCEIKEDGILVYFDSPSFTIGQLKVMKEYDVTSLHYSDGTKNIVSTERTNVIITCGVTDATSIVYDGVALNYVNTISQLNGMVTSATTIINEITEAIDNIKLTITVGNNNYNDF